MKMILIFFLLMLDVLKAEVVISGKGKVEYETFKANGNAINTNLAVLGDNPLIQVDLNFEGRILSFLKVGAIMRFENNFRGFYGTGDSFQAREVFLEATLMNFMKIKIGDFRKSLTKLTLWADEGEFEYESKLFLLQREDLKYQYYLTEKNSWPLEGLDLKAGFLIEPIFNAPFPNEFTVEGFISKIDTASASKAYDRYFSGARIAFYNMDILKIGGTCIFVNDLKETKYADQIQPPIMINILASDLNIDLAKMFFDNKIIKLKLESEIAKSITATNSSEKSPIKIADTGLFMKAEAGVFETKVFATMFDNGNEFLSPGAQTWTFNYYGQNYFEEQNITNSLFFRNYNNKLQIIHRWNVPLNISKPFSYATPNRRGIGLGFSSKNLDFIEFLIKTESLKEIRPIGCNELRNFKILEAGGKFYLNKFLGSKIFPVINGVYFNEKVERNDDKITTPFDDESENIETKLFDAGAEFYVTEKLSFLLAYQKITQLGKCFFDVNDENNIPLMITAHQKYEVDFITTVLSLGFYYEFNKFSALRIEYNQIKYQNNQNLSANYILYLMRVFYEIKF